MADERLTPRQWASERLERLEDRLEDLSVSRIIPSALTLLGLCSGLTSIRFALVEDWRRAVAAIFCAMLFDMLDGRAARWLGADSRFGVQLDSLADLVSFGVAPAVLAYTWSLSQMDTAGWIAALKPFGPSEKSWICPTIQNLMQKPDYTKSENVRVDYIATPFDDKPTTPHQWPRQPWFIETGDVHGHGNLIIFTDGSITDLRTVTGK